MINAFLRSMEIYESYSGTSMIFVWFIISMLYLWTTEKDNDIKLLFCHLMCIMGVLFFFPPFAYTAIHVFLDNQTYYRFIWLMPIGLIVSYVAVKLVFGVASPKYRRVLAISIIIGMMVSGNFIYSNNSVTMAKNEYKLPVDVVSAADIMHVDGMEVKAVVPAEMLQFIRQYDASIMLAYGRDALVEGWSGNPLYDAMESVPVRSWQISDTARQQLVDYIVLRTGTPIAGSRPLSSYEYSYLTSTGIYDIYIFDRAVFAEEKKEQYKNNKSDSYTENWIDTSKDS